MYNIVSHSSIAVCDTEYYECSNSLSYDGMITFVGESGRDGHAGKIDQFILKNVIMFYVIVLFIILPSTAKFVQWAFNRNYAYTVLLTNEV